jgi:hypothetical protein
MAGFKALLLDFKAVFLSLMAYQQLADRFEAKSSTILLMPKSLTLKS